MSTSTIDHFVPSLSYVERQQRSCPNSLLASMMTAKQAADALGITQGTLYQRVAAGTAPAHHRLGKRLMFHRRDVEAAA